MEGLGAMIASYADGSQESALAIEAMAGASTEELQGMVTEWLALQEAQGNTAQGVTDLATEYGSLKEDFEGFEGATDFFTKMQEGSDATSENIANFATVTEEQLQAISTSWTTLKTAQTGITGEMKTDLSGLVTAFNTAMSDIAKSLTDAVSNMDKYQAAYAKGKNTIQGFIDGSESLRSQIITKYQSLAKAAMDAFDVTLDINSPSKEFAWRGEMAVTGFIEQTQAMQPEVQRAMAETADLGLEAFTAENAQVVAFAPELMAAMSAASAPRNVMEVNGDSSYSRGGDIYITIAPNYGDISGVRDVEGVKNVLHRNNEDLKELVLDVMEEVGIDARRVSYI